MFGKFVSSSFVGILDGHSDSAVSLVLFDAHEVPQSCAGHICRLLCLLLSFSLLPALINDPASFPTEYRHVTLRISNSGDRLQLLREDRTTVEKRRPEIVDE